MRWLAILVVVVSSLMSSTATSGYSFGDWASDQGFDPGAVMPNEVKAYHPQPSIDNFNGILHMTQADYDAFNTAGGGLLATWDGEPGHHVAFAVPEPSTPLLCFVALVMVGGWRK